MSSQVRALLAVALATIILFGAQFLLPGPKEPPAPTNEKAGSTTTKPSASLPEKAPAPLDRQQGRKAAPKAPEREAIVETDVVKAVLTSRGGALKSWRLKSYRAADGQGVDLVALQQEGEPLGPLLVSSGNPEEPAPVDFDIDKAQLSLRSPSETGSITFSSRGSGPLRLSKRVTFRGNSYRVRLSCCGKTRARSQ